MEHFSDQHFQSSNMPLGNCDSYTSPDVEEAQAIISNIFCPHIARPKCKNKSIDFRLNRQEFGKSSSLNYVRYGPEIVIEPGEMEHVFNVQFQLSGKTETYCGNSQYTVTQGQACILSPTRYVKMDWSTNSCMMIYSISRNTMERMLNIALDGYHSDSIIFEPIMDTRSKSSGQFVRALAFLQSELEISEKMFNSPLATEHFEKSLALSLIYSQKHNYTSALERGVSPAAPVHVKRAEEYIRANAKNYISLEDLTQASGVSARTLFEGFRRFRSTSPMKYVRDTRMEYVHSDLKKPTENQTVTEVALKWGFSQLGRFSVEYKKRFGESPSSTLKRSTNERKPH